MMQQLQLAYVSILLCHPSRTGIGRPRCENVRETIVKSVKTSKLGRIEKNVKRGKTFTTCSSRRRPIGCLVEMSSK